jgi:hypothetical protein
VFSDLLLKWSKKDGFYTSLQQPVVLTVFSPSDYQIYIYLDIIELTPALNYQFIPASYGQGHRLFQQTSGSLSYAILAILI